MAYYENLPNYKKAMDLDIQIERVVSGFSRYHKYTLGKDLRDLSRSLVVQIIQANNSHGSKRQKLMELRDRSEELKTTLLIAKEVKAFKSFAQFQQCVELTVNVCRQSEGWRRSQKK